MAEFQNIERENPSSLEKYLLEVIENEKRMDENSSSLLHTIDKMKYRIEIMTVQLEKLKLWKGQESVEQPIQGSLYKLPQDAMSASNRIQVSISEPTELDRNLNHLFHRLAANDSSHDLRQDSSYTDRTFAIQNDWSSLGVAIHNMDPHNKNTSTSQTEDNFNKIQETFLPNRTVFDCHFSETLAEKPQLQTQRKSSDDNIAMNTFHVAAFKDQSPKDAILETIQEPQQMNLLRTEKELSTNENNNSEIIDHSKLNINMNSDKLLVFDDAKTADADNDQFAAKRNDHHLAVDRQNDQSVTNDRNDQFAAKGNDDQFAPKMTDDQFKVKEDDHHLTVDRQYDQSVANDKNDEFAANDSNYQQVINNDKPLVNNDQLHDDKSIKIIDSEEQLPIPIDGQKEKISVNKKLNAEKSEKEGSLLKDSTLSDVLKKTNNYHETSDTSPQVFQNAGVEVSPSHEIQKEFSGDSIHETKRKTEKDVKGAVAKNAAKGSNTSISKPSTYPRPLPQLPEEVSSENEEDYQENYKSLTASTAYQSLIGGMPLPPWNQPRCEDSESEDDVERALALHAQANKSLLNKNSSPKKSPEKSSVKKDKAATASKGASNASRKKSVSGPTSGIKSKLSKASRKALGLDSDSDDSLEEAVKTKTVAEDSDEFDFYD